MTNLLRIMLAIPIAAGFLWLIVTPRAKVKMRTYIAVLLCWAGYLSGYAAIFHFWLKAL
jgi:hypothetical protein